MMESYPNNLCKSLKCIFIEVKILVILLKSVSKWFYLGVDSVSEIKPVGPFLCRHFAFFLDRQHTLTCSSVLEYTPVFDKQLTGTAYLK